MLAHTTLENSEQFCSYEALNSVGGALCLLFREMARDELRFYCTKFRWRAAAFSVGMKYLLQSLLSLRYKEKHGFYHS